MSILLIYVVTSHPKRLIKDLRLSRSSPVSNPVMEILKRFISGNGTGLIIFVTFIYVVGDTCIEVEKERDSLHPIFFLCHDILQSIQMKQQEELVGLFL